MRALSIGAIALAVLACRAQERPSGRVQSAVLAAGPRQLVNLRTLPNGYAPILGGAIMSAGGRLFFTNGDEATGVELWTSDGTAAGTHVLRDVCPGRCNGYEADPWSPPRPVGAGGLVVFVGSDGSTGEEPWRTDGTESGTWMVKDALPGLAGSYPSGAAVLGDRAFFVADDPVAGREPFVTDGTPDGTVLLGDLATGRATSNPTSATACGGKVFFSANAGAGYGLWVTDGTPAGTAPVPGAPAIDPPLETLCWGTTLFFPGRDGTARRLWRADGTAGGTAMVTDSPESPAALAVSGSWLYFAGGSSGARNLWRSDGAAAFPLTAGGRAIAAIVDAGGVPVVFDGADPAVGTEPYRWNEGAQALELLHDVAPGAGSSFGSWPISSGGMVFFVAKDGGLWVTDGTTAGTAAAGIRPSTRQSQPLAAFQGGVAFLVERWDSAMAFTTIELWRWDGIASASRVGAVQVSPASSDPTGFTSLGGTAYFVARSDTSGRGLFRTDGTAAGTVLVQGGIAAVYQPQEIIAWSGALWLAGGGVGSATGRELFRSDGVNLATVVEDVCPGLCDGLARDPSFTPAGQKLFFLGTSAANGLELRATDAAGAGAVLVKDLAATDSVFERRRLAVIGGTVLFPVGEGFFRNELWRSDGTAVGTALVQDFGSGGSFPPQELTTFLGDVFFAAQGQLGMELYRSDGTSAGTRLVKDISPGPAGSFPSRLVASGDALFFVARGGEGGRALWRSDGTEPGTREVAAFADVSSMVAMDGAVYLAATDGVSGYELWRSDGTAAGTTRIVDAWPGPTGGLVGGPLFAFPGTSLVFFPAADPLAGMELWVSNGSAGGSHRVADLRPGSLPSSPLDLAAAGSLLYFSASDGVTAREPWVLDVSQLGDVVAPDIVCPPGTMAEATSPAGAAVAYPPAVASDDVTPTDGIELAYGAPSGATFPIGTTLVAATASDAAGNRRSCTFRVTVVDTTAPSLACPPDVHAEATGPAGAPVTFTAASVGDAATAEPAVVASPASGTTFFLGTTSVTLVATDASGNAATCTFAVTVADTRPPVLVCPADRTVEATSSEGAIVTVEPASVEDAVTAAPVISSAPSSGSVFPMGTTEVALTATDAAGNRASCTFSVTVTAPKTGGDPGGGCSTGGGASGPLTLLALWALGRGRIRWRGERLRRDTKAGPLPQ